MQAQAQRSRLVDGLVEDFKQRTPLRTGSLIVTIFGDSVAPRGGAVSLGSLIEVLAPLGISHRLVRTAAYRLVQDGVLVNEQVGRRSFYSLTDSGRLAFNEASSRIYALSTPPWDCQWHLLLLSRVPQPQRAAIRKALQWLGFGSFGAELLAHPHPDLAALQETLCAVAGGGQVIYLTGQAPTADRNVLDLVRDAWQLEELEANFSRFVDTFSPVAEAVRKDSDLAPADAFYLRTFLIHEYRKALLRDPGLPEALLPQAWHGHAARQLTAAIYRAVGPASEAFIDAQFVNQSGVLPPPDPAFDERYR